MNLMQLGKKWSLCSIRLGYPLCHIGVPSMGGHVQVPCREAERWVRVLNQVRGIYIAEHNYLTSTGGANPTSIPTCVPETEATYDEETETLIVPQLYLDGKTYRTILNAPFNIQELEHLGELGIYHYDE